MVKCPFLCIDEQVETSLHALTARHEALDSVQTHGQNALNWKKIKTSLWLVQDELLFTDPEEECIAALIVPALFSIVGFNITTVFCIPTVWLPSTPVPETGQKRLIFSQEKPAKHNWGLFFWKYYQYETSWPRVWYCPIHPSPCSFFLWIRQAYPHVLLESVCEDLVSKHTQVHFLIITILVSFIP